MTKTIKTLIALTALLCTQDLCAQQDSAKKLSEVIVTGQYQPQTAKNSVYQVRTITKERIQKQGATNVQTVLNNELNIRFSQDVATGGAGITMMGLPGQNVKVLLDGAPLTGRQGSTNEADLNQIDINTIERIEIVEGPMSVVYGADALAGVINIITKKAAPQKLAVVARLHEESVGKEYDLKKQGIHNQYIGFSARIKDFELGGGFGHNYFGGWKDTATDRELTWHKKDQLLANGYIAYHKGKINLRYRIDGLDEVITNPGNFLFPQQSSGDVLAQDQEYLTSRVMQQLQGTYTANKNLNIFLQSSYTDYSRQVFSTTVSKHTGNVRLDISNGRQSLVDFKGFNLRTLVNYRLSKGVAFQPGIDINTESGDGERLKAGSNKIEDYAFFASAEITPWGNKVNIRPGIRVIKNSVYDAPPVIPSVNAKIALTKDLDLRLAYANGFRAPSLRELYFNFFDANHQIIGNPDLKAETSNSFTGSLNWEKISSKKIAYTAALAGFYNKTRNLIDYGIAAGNPSVFTLLNIYDSRTAGFSLGGTARYRQLNVALGGSYVGFYNDYSEQDKTLPTMVWSPEINSTAGYSFIKIGLDVNFYYKFTGKRPRYVTDLQTQTIVLSKVQDYQMADVTANKKIGKYLVLNAGIRNLFNTTGVSSSIASGGVHAGSSNVTSIANGRSFFAGLNFNWTKK